MSKFFVVFAASLVFALSASAGKIKDTSCHILVHDDIFFKEEYRSHREQLMAKGYKLFACEHNVPNTLKLTNLKNDRCQITYSAKLLECTTCTACTFELLWEGDFAELPICTSNSGPSSYVEDISSNDNDDSN